MYVFKECLRRLREERGLKQETIAKHFKVTPVTYGHWERGRSEPNMETLSALADYFDVSVDYLLGRNSERRPNPEPADDIDIARFLVLVPSAEGREELVPVSLELREKLIIAVRDYRRERRVAIQRGEWPPPENGRSQ